MRYVSLDPSIAMVDSTGLVTGIADGATTACVPSMVRSGSASGARSRGRGSWS